MLIMVEPGNFGVEVRCGGNGCEPGFEDYDYNSPWNIQVGIYDGKDKEIDFSKPGLSPSQRQIMRHKRDGEVPSFLWKNLNFGHDYQCGDG
jgi:hypothetical protein